MTQKMVSCWTSIAHPCSSDMVRKSAKECGAVAKKRDVKFTEYAEQQIPGIDSPRMIPCLRTLHFGVWGQKQQTI